MAPRQISHGRGDGQVLGQSPQDKLAFYGASPITQPTSAAQAVATDLASVIALANALRLALVNLGLIKGS